MPPHTGLRIARVRPLFLNNGTGSCTPTLAPLFITTYNIRARKRLAPPQPSSSSSLSSRRTASTASQAKETKTKPPPTISELASSPTRPSSPLPPSSTLNPPASTRPPPLELPTRDPATSMFTYWYQYGKAYMTFYKTGLRAILTNRRLLSQSTSSISTTNPSPSDNPTRSDILLRERVHHDLFRVPAFALLLLVCGELTPLVVIAFPRLTPYTCRIPNQISALQRRSEARRARSYASLKHAQLTAHDLRGGLASGHVCRALGLTSPLWDRIGIDSPFGSSLATRAVVRIAEDDALIRKGGGVDALVDEEVVLACEDRGMDVRGRDVDQLRAELRDWLRKAAPAKGGSREEARKEAEDRIRGLLLGIDGADGKS
ncbi:uncharacterized protein F4807DRAFT_321040 [Annulohypoxylon truncatum]|uniref:uncharacterized protein n=1 Tax=Annulohypoxylon truncatum TaxID=327061 RepID=UPI002008D202|nr:uncharacterized protein F4807DRAFT_321040 [Annulohypoxylon truncatum]KAI1204728.1 hypothetical protein F4807DRAFT_321040 [Annulohypoxylon truncatum]